MKTLRIHSKLNRNSQKLTLCALVRKTNQKTYQITTGQEFYNLRFLNMKTTKLKTESQRKTILF